VNRKPSTVRLVARAARVLLLLVYGAGQGVLAAHVHEIAAPARAAAVRRAEARETAADCPVCQFAAQARAAAASAAAAPVPVRAFVFVVSAAARLAPAQESSRASARAPPAAS
jgi:hypothetical protein